MWASAARYRVEDWDGRGVHDRSAARTPETARAPAPAGRRATPAATGLLAVQQAAGNRAVAGLLTARGGHTAVQRGLLDTITDRVGDALDLRSDEERLDAEEELAEFREKSFPCKTDFKPSSGRGQFDACFDARTGALTITLKVGFEFDSGDPSRVAPGFRPEEFDWTPEEQAAWKTKYLADVSAAWSGAHAFHSTRPHWSAMTVATTVEVVENAANPHFVATIGKYPPDAIMVTSSVCPPGTHHGSGNTCPAHTPAADGTTPGHGTGEFDSNDLRREAKLGGGPNTSIPFSVGGTTLTAAGIAALAPLVSQMQAAPDSTITLVGRASSTHPSGMDAADGAIHNMDLARQRTGAVQAHLIAAGIGSDRILVRNLGETDAAADRSWCRVDASVSTRQTQVAAAHEAGHMLGMGDEYPTASNAAGTPVEARYATMIKDQTNTVLTRQRNDSLMSSGSTVEPWHYSSFLEALKSITAPIDEWSV